jgi:hypothetical protein
MVQQSVDIMDRLDKYISRGTDRVPYGIYKVGGWDCQKLVSSDPSWVITYCEAKSTLESSGEYIRDKEEYLTVLSGELIVCTDGTENKLVAGDNMRIRGGIKRSINPVKKDAKFLSILI